MAKDRRNWQHLFEDMDLVRSYLAPDQYEDWRFLTTVISDDFKPVGEQGLALFEKYAARIHMIPEICDPLFSKSIAYLRYNFDGSETNSMYLLSKGCIRHEMRNLACGLLISGSEYAIIQVKMEEFIEFIPTPLIDTLFEMQTIEEIIDRYLEPPKIPNVKLIYRDGEFRFGRGDDDESEED